MTVSIFNWNYIEIVSQQGGVGLFECGILCLVSIEKKLLKKEINSEGKINKILKSQSFIFYFILIFCLLYFYDQECILIPGPLQCGSSSFSSLFLSCTLCSLWYNCRQRMCLKDMLRTLASNQGAAGSLQGCELGKDVT